MPKQTRPIIIGLGEILWDLLPGGKQLGGAPANFAYHAGVLGAEAHVVSAVGNDDLAAEIIARLDRLGVCRDLVCINRDHPTGTVSVKTDDRGKPSYAIQANVAWDHIPLSADLIDLAREADAMCFGSLAQRSRVSRATIRACLEAASGRGLRIFDVNLRQHYYDAEVVDTGLQMAEVLKLNDEELPVVAGLLGISGGTKEVLRSLLKKYDLRLIALTRGEKGAVLAARDQWSEQIAAPTKVVDTVGAGDAFTAVLAMGVLRGLALEVINRHACRLAAYVCSQPGATPDVPAELASGDSEGLLASF